MTQLSVNLNAVAQLRNRRNLAWPSVTGMARLVLDAGAHGLTVHPRPDERHIRRSDVHDLGALLRADYVGREFNIEGYPSEPFLELVAQVRPDQVTLVPDTPDQFTSDHGWDIPRQADTLTPAIATIRQLGIRVSLFVDPCPACAEHALQLGADRIELYTGRYGGAVGSAAIRQCLAELAATARQARRHGLGVNAGHDLTLGNLAAFQANVPGITEVSIGHAITADALIMGFPAAVRRYVAALA